MTELTLIAPSLDYKEQILAYRNEFTQHRDHLHGGARLQELVNLNDWLEHVRRSSYESCEEGRTPSSTFLCIRESDKTMVGICNIRHDLNSDFLINTVGHIGYSIRPSERRKGYATEQLRLALLEAKKLGINRVLVTAADWNIGSQKTILANGGVYEDTRFEPDGGDHMLRYWIENK